MNLPGRQWAESPAAPTAVPVGSQPSRGTGLPTHHGHGSLSLSVQTVVCIVQLAERPYGLDIKVAPPASGAADYDNYQVVSQDSLSLPAVPSTCRLSTLRPVSGDRHVIRTLPYGVLELE